MKRAFCLMVGVLLLVSVFYSINALAKGKELPVVEIQPVEGIQAVGTKPVGEIQAIPEPWFAGKDVLKGKVIDFKDLLRTADNTPHCEAKIGVTETPTDRTVEQPVKVGSWQTSNTATDARDICSILKRAKAGNIPVIFVLEDVRVRSKDDPSKIEDYQNVMGVSFDVYK